VTGECATLNSNHFPDSTYHFSCVQTEIDHAPWGKRGNRLMLAGIGMMPAFNYIKALFVH